MGTSIPPLLLAEGNVTCGSGSWTTSWSKFFLRGSGIHHSNKYIVQLKQGKELDGGGREVDL